MPLLSAKPFTSTPPKAPSHCEVSRPHELRAPTLKVSRLAPPTMPILPLPTGTSAPIRRPSPLSASLPALPSPSVGYHPPRSLRHPADLATAGSSLRARNDCC